MNLNKKIKYLIKFPNGFILKNIRNYIAIAIFFPSTPQSVQNSS